MMLEPEDQQRDDQHDSGDDQRRENECALPPAQPAGLAVDHRVGPDRPASAHLVDSLGSHDRRL